MPIVRVEMFSGRSVEQKREFAAAVTEDAVRILKTSAEAVHIVFVDVEKTDWAAGGKLYSDT